MDNFEPLGTDDYTGGVNTGIGLVHSAHTSYSGPWEILNPVMLPLFATMAIVIVYKVWPFK